jgi:DNA-binding NtrC family response regulator
MSTKKLNILVVDDETRVLDEIGEFLTSKGYQIFTSVSAAGVFDILKETTIDIIILDIKLPKTSGLDVLEQVKKTWPDIEVIMISGHGDMNTVIEAMRKGATDYFQKPFRLLDINNAILRTHRFIEVNNKLKTAENDLEILSAKLLENIGSQLLGESKSMRKLKEKMARVAAAPNTSVLILGESGTGKELVAHGIHYMSKRNKQTFYSVNCSAIPESLFESEFFGHKKGSFTGAHEDKAGWFEIANNGTLFLDEISDMPLNQQAKLLRVLEERKVSKVGSRKSIDVDVRVIAASNQNLEKLADENKFRLDLFHRLSIFTIEIPPLRDRRSDIPLLLDYYVKQYAKIMEKEVSGIDEQVVEMLSEHLFPGNVRQLKNMVEKAVILSDSKILQPEHFDSNKQVAKAKEESSTAFSENGNFDLEENEKRLIMRALQESGNNKAKASALLNITWQALDRRLKKYEIEI